MAELSNIESINERFGELKKLIDDVKSNMMSGDDCNNQFYTIIQNHCQIHCQKMSALVFTK